jgi:alpha-D-xyloside xylohydrolase
MKWIAEGVWRITLGRPEKRAPVRLRAFPPCREALLELSERALGRHASPPLDRKRIRFRVTQRGCVVTLPLQPEEQVYGFGLQLKSHNQRGLKKCLRVNSDPVADTGDTHAPVPFYVTTAGYGVLVDTLRYATFACGSSLPVRGAPDTPAQPSMVVEIPAARGVELYLFAGPSLREAVQRYNLFAGGGCLPALWGLGVWYRSYALADQGIVDRQREYFRRVHIPCDVFGLEPAWQTHAYSSSFLWDRKRFPDPDRTLDELRRAGYQVSLWEHAFIHPSAPFYGELKRLSADHEVWGGLVPDFSLPKAQAVFADYHEREFVARGIRSFKLDECDNSDYLPTPWSFPEFARFPSGLDGEQYHSLFGALYQRTIYPVLHGRDLRTYGQVRSAHALQSPLPFVLYSDLYDHRDYIRALVNSGFSGLLWTPELRWADSPSDLLRRVQTIVFSPHALVNAFELKNPPWLQYDRERNNREELLPDYGPLEARVRELFELRMALLPYLYAAFARYHYEGLPPVRALVMDYPADPATHGLDDQYLFGDSLLAAPVFAGQEARGVYLPAGGWYDFWTGRRYQGGQSHTLAVEEDRMPVFVKENSLLPLARPVEHVTRETQFELTVRVYGERAEPFRLLEDDGFSFGFERGELSWLQLSWDPEAGGHEERQGSYAVRRYRVAGWEVVASRGRGRG